MATKAAIESYLNMLPQWRDQPEGLLGQLARLGATVETNPQAMAAFLDKMRLDGRLRENPEYRDAFNEFWENPIEDHWAYQTEAAEELLVRLLRGEPVTVANLESVWPSVKPRLGTNEAYSKHVRKLRDSSD